VNFIPQGQAGANFGWDLFEGTRPFEGGAAPGHVPPVLERLHADGDCSITGGYVVRDPGLGALAGRYVYGDLCTGQLRSALLRTPAAQDDRSLGLTVSQLSSFGEDGGGCIYLVSLAGQVYRLLETGVPRPLPCPRPATSSVAPVDESAPPTSNTDGPVVVDTTPPETSITAAPARTIVTASVVFRFASSEPAARFQCRLGVRPWSACFSPVSFIGLSDGRRTFEVRALDSAGNIDPSPARVGFAVRRRAVYGTLQSLARAVSSAVRAGGRAALVRGSAIAVPYAPVVGGRVRAELRGRVRGGAIAVVGRGSVAFAARQGVRLRLRTTPAAERLVPGMRRAWFRVTFSNRERAASIPYTQRILLRRPSEGP
jgi:hypothetical protein